MTNKTFFENHPHWKWDVSLMLLGVIIGLVSGFCLSVWWQHTMDAQTDKITAQKIYDELNTPENPVNTYSQFYKNTDTTGPLAGKMNVGTNSLLIQPSVFPSILDKIQRFDNSLYQNITFYYSNLTVAEDDRLNLVKAGELEESSSNKSALALVLIYSESYAYNNMRERLSYCYNQIPIIKKQLHDTYGVQ
jgi:hypothetical protein